jgi:DNA-directed RNA polymerase subunit RPC12/RpoP
MKINPDGTFFLEHGELVPFICPLCKYPIEYDEKPLMIKCTACGHMDFKEKFITDIEMRDNKQQNG